jgi:hypothetical protein
MDLTKLASSVAQTGQAQEIGLAVLKRAQDMEKSTATQLINSVRMTPTVQNLPPNLGNTINTTA